jgi:hypothetical protein
MSDCGEALHNYVVDLYKGIYGVSDLESCRYMRKILGPKHSLCAIQEWIEDFLSVDIHDPSIVTAMIFAIDLQKVKTSLQEWRRIKLTR